VLERVLNSFVFTYVFAGVLTATLLWIFTPATISTFEEFVMCAAVWPIIWIAFMYAIPYL
jgi:hypothetical protein